MRSTLVTIVAAGALGATAVAVGAPAIATTTAPAATAPAATAPVTSTPSTGTPSTGTATDLPDMIKQALAGLVTGGTLDQAQADKVASTLGSMDLGRGGFGGPGGFGHGGSGRGGQILSAAATALTMTPAQLRTALDGGKTLAQVAKDRGVSVDTLVSALVNAERARIAQAVADKRITQAQADRRLAGVRDRVTNRVNGVHPARMGHEGWAPDGPSQTPAPAATPTA